MAIISQAGTLLAKAATQTISVAAAVTFSSATVDDDTLWSISTPTIITVGTTCWHDIAVSVPFTAGRGSARVQLRVNGTALDAGVIVDLDAMQSKAAVFSRLRSLTATDTLDVLVTPITGNPEVAAGATLGVCYGQLGTSSVTSAKILDGTIATGDLAALAVTKAKALVFVSTEQTATGSSQNVAHGLAATPALVLIVPTAGHDGAGGAGTQMPTIAEGAHDGTNVVVTVTAGAKFKALAWA